MNEQDNVRLIQQIYAAFGRGDVQAILDRLSPDVEWIMDGPEVIPYTGRRVGISQTKGFFNALATTQQDQKLTINEYIAQGDTVATVGRYSALVTATGKQMDCAVAHVFSVRDGLVTRYLGFADTAHMAEAYASRMAAAS